MLVTDLIEARMKDSRRLMVVLHGLGDSMEGYRWLPSALGLSWLNYLLVNAPATYYGGFSWYDFANDPGPDILLSRKMLFAVLDGLQTRGFPTEQTVLFGFSQGCLMTIDVGLRYHRLFAGLVGISGYVFEPESVISERSTVAFQQRLLLTHGRYDSLIPIAPVREQVQLLKRAGFNIDWREFNKDHTIAGDEELAVIRQFVCRVFEPG